ncbi:MAG: hypothetical protein ACSHX7_07800 [Luteolibacter sp.]
MKYASYNNIRTHAKDVESGSIGADLWYREYEVKACVGRYLQYWVYTSDKPQLPSGYEPESSWHASWKGLVKDEFTEVVCGDLREHRADILVGKQVIEIQRSRIDIRDAEERVKFYKALIPESRVIWIIDVQKSWGDKKLKKGLNVKGKKNMFRLEWAKGSRHKWMVDLSRTPDTHVYFEFNNENENMMKVWVNKGKIYASWVKKTKFFNDHLKNYSNLKTEKIYKVLGFKSSEIG